METFILNRSSITKSSFFATFCIMSLVLFQTCAEQNEVAASKVISGTDTNGYPFVTASVTDRDEFCSGSFISHNVYLTAGHCIANAKFIRTLGVESSVLVLHPEYSSDSTSIADFVQNDLGIAIFPAQTYTGRPAILSHSSRLDDSVTAIGLGCTNIRTQIGVGKKRTAKIPAEPLTSGVISSKLSPKGLCPGDSGGPAIIDNTIEGVASMVRVERDEYQSYWVNLTSESSKEFLKAVKKYVDSDM